MEEPILSVRHLRTCLELGSHAYAVVDGISFDLYAGKTLALVGESGCGKSMAALSLMRILPTPPALPSQGEVLYKGQNLLKISEKEMRSIRGGKIAMIFQDPSSALNPVYTIGSQMSEVTELHLGLFGEAALDRAIMALSEVGIASASELLNAYPHQLSGGMKQRVMIAMALLCEPDILIADEPTTALDVTIQAQVLALIKHLQSSRGLAVLLITHDMGVVAEVADDVIVMYAAQGVEKGSIDQIFNYQAHPYTMGLFESRPGIFITQGKLPVIKGQVPSPTHFPHGCRFHPRCPFVMDKCHHGDVPDFIVEENPAHWAKCWLHDGTKESELKVQEGKE